MTKAIILFLLVVSPSQQITPQHPENRYRPSKAISSGNVYQDPQRETLKKELEIRDQTIDDLNKSLENANETIRNLDALVNGFSTLYTIIAIVYGVIGIMVVAAGIFLGFVNFRNVRAIQAEATHFSELARERLVLFEKSSESELDRARNTYGDLRAEVNKLKIEFSTYYQSQVPDLLEQYVKNALAKDRNQGIDQALHNFKSDVQALRDNARSYLNKIYATDYSLDHLFKMKTLLQQEKLSIEEVEDLSYKLWTKGDNNVSDDFFLNIVYYRHLYESEKVRDYTYRYLLTSKLGQRLEAVAALILKCADSAKEYLRVVQDTIRSDGNFIVELINIKELNESQKIDRKKIIDELKSPIFDQMKIRDQINQSLLSKLG